MITEVTIVGAGPYGLSIAAHLRGLNISFRILGSPMGFWITSTPENMSLKSDGFASSLYDPDDEFTLSQYCARQNLPYADLGLPVSRETFISYCLAFQKRFVPNVELQSVTSVKAHEGGFSLTLDNGESFVTQKLIIAVGVGNFTNTPAVLTGLPSNLVTHSSQHQDLSPLSDKDVAIVGAGSSALDLAALLNRAGARPVVITRGLGVQIHGRQALPRTLLSRMLAPTSGVGPGWRFWFYCSAPLIFHFLPERRRLQETKGHLGPAGGWFIKEDIVGKVPIVVNAAIDAAVVEGDRIRLQLSPVAGPSHLTVDHVIAATGYQIDIDRISFLDESLRAQIDTVEKTPILSSNFESSVQGLYFVGPAAANSFGPTQRFAFGARFAARRLSRHLGGPRKDA
jgi:lysine/ornithine N-monooxygenase